MLLKLSYNTVCLVAHSGVIILVIVYIIVHKLLFVNCSNGYQSRSYKMLHSVEIFVSYVIIRAQRLHARKDNEAPAHFSKHINN